jgi:hypothetical protein
MRSVVAAAVAMLASCSAGEPDLSTQAVELALRRQTTVRLDVALAREMQGALDRAWFANPVLRCADVLHVYVGGGDTDLPPDVSAAWQRGDLLTGNQAVDALMKEFEFTEVLYSEAAGLRIYSLQFGEPANLDLLAQHFLDQTGIAAEPVPSSGDGDSISIARTPQEIDLGLGTGWWMRFERKWGDCLAGCIYGRTWEVFVPGDGAEVAMLAEAGDSIPPGLDALCSSR